MMSMLSLNLGNQQSTQEYKIERAGTSLNGANIASMLNIEQLDNYLGVNNDQPTKETD